MGKKKFNYSAFLRQELGDTIDQLDLPAREKRFIKGRWLDQLLWLEGRAGKDQKKYLRLRIITIVGGVIVPALVSLNNVDNVRLRNFLRWVTFGTSLTVAVSAAVEEFFQYGQSYRRYRNTAEGLKIEGWSYFQLSSPYEDAQDHQDAYKTFAAHVESIIQKDVEGYNAEMMKKQEKQSEEGSTSTTTKKVTTTILSDGDDASEEPEVQEVTIVETAVTVVEDLPPAEKEAATAEEATESKEAEIPATDDDAKA
ncbi:MAG: DUF4231 domain-containing protein [Limnothrix sp. RL_2_0]|nr:DUF4231 domain-containing protein [Limnothrix sp. RL_2_0]